MASQLSTSAEQALLKEVKLLLWGTSLKEDVFSRWTQGFIFSEKTTTALVQLQGGPCAVLAPVQAFIIKCGLFKNSHTKIEALTSVSAERASHLLFEALFEILSQMNSSQYILVSLNKAHQAKPLHSSTEQHKCGDNGEASRRPILDESIYPKGTGAMLCYESFHANLKCFRCTDKNELHRALEKCLPELQSSFGVLLYLYSLVLSKGVQQIKNEVEDPGEPLIDVIYGHGSQSLINLLLTSQATSYVWDNDKDVSGLKLRGLEKQSTIGFLSLLEHMRYCEVGWFYKNPKFPIWVLGSETHLTVIFSTNEHLVFKDNPVTNARHVFSQFDSEGNGFISSSVLDEVMKVLDLVADKEYVDIMRDKLDSEHLGIITRNSFMEEFFPEELPEQPKSFHLYHYNGLPQSCPDGKVTYMEGYAVLDEEVDTQFITDTSPIKLCLQTKWPSIELTWANKVSPSLN